MHNEIEAKRPPRALPPPEKGEDKSVDAEDAQNVNEDLSDADEKVFEKPTSQSLDETKESDYNSDDNKN